MRHWARTLNTRLAWLAGCQHELGQAFASVTSLESLHAAYHGLILPHVTTALANDPAQLLAALGPRLVHVGDTDALAPLHPAAQLRSTPAALAH